MRGLDPQERPAPEALALLGGLEQERRPAAAQLEVGGDGRLAVVDERVAQRHERVVARQLAHLVERGRVEVRRSAATAIELLEGVGEAEAARGQQHGQVVEHVGGLLAQALVRLLAQPRAPPPRPPRAPSRRCAAGRPAARRCSSPRATRRARSAMVRSSAASASCGRLACRRCGSTCARPCGRPGRPARPARGSRPDRSRSGAPRAAGRSRGLTLVPELAARAATRSGPHRSRACVAAPPRSCRRA